MARLTTFKDCDLAGKRVLVRVDLNVPMKEGVVLDTTRIEAIAPTVSALLEKGARVVLLSHRGRPKGKSSVEFSLEPLVPTLSDILKIPVVFEQEGAVSLQENLRFDPGEEQNSLNFAEKIAALGDIYINDAFAVSHRAHASVSAITQLLPSYAGLLLEKEVTSLETSLSKDAHPVAAIVGGSKVSTKFDLLRSLCQKVDLLIVGGGIANTFLSAQNIPIGTSLYEPDAKDLALEVLKSAKEQNCHLILPTDVVVAHNPTDLTSVKQVSIHDIQDDQAIFDLGPESLSQIVNSLAGMKTLLWNGPLGYFEQSPFEQGTLTLATKVAHLTKEKGLVSIAGGGETVAAIKQSGHGDEFTYLSTGGGAFLEYIEGRQLPGVQALLSTSRD